MKVLKSILLLFLMIMASNTHADFLHPMDFDSSEAHKNRVIQIIKKRVEKDYCNSGVDMCQEATLRMMERENLNAFKLASKATDRKIMDRVVLDYCHSGIDMCSYSVIWMMYKENLNASKQELNW